MVAPANYIEPWWIIVLSVKDDDCRRYLQDAVMAYGVYGTIFDFSNSPDKSGCLEALFYQIKEQIDHKTKVRETRRKSGAKGGAPKGNRNAAKARPEKEAQPQTQQEPQAVEPIGATESAQAQQAANKPERTSQPTKGAESNNGRRQVYSDRVESVETLFRRNIKAPVHEFDRAKLWVSEKYSGSGWDGLTLSEKNKVISKWRPETPGERFPGRFLSVWGDVIAKAKEEGTDERVILAMMSDNVRFAVENDRWCVYVPKQLREWIRDNANRYSDIITNGGKIKASIIAL